MSKKQEDIRQAHFKVQTHTFRAVHQTLSFINVTGGTARASTDALGENFVLALSHTLE